MSWRDVMCGDPRPEHVGQALTLAGWVDTRRDHGGLVFVDLRDHTGVTQLVINPERSPTAAELAKEIRNEFVLRARGEVVARSAETINAAMATGAVELQVDELEIVSRSTPLPFQLDEEGVDENAAPTLSLARSAHGAHAAQHAPVAHRHLVDPPDDGRSRASSTSGRPA